MTGSVTWSPSGGDGAPASLPAAIRPLPPILPGLPLERVPNSQVAWRRAELDTAIRDADRLHQALTRLLDRGHDQLDRR